MFRNLKEEICTLNFHPLYVLSGNSSSDEPERVFNTQLLSQGSKGNVYSPMPHITLSMLPLLEGTFLAPNMDIPSIKCDDGRQLLGKSSSDEPSRIFYAGTSNSQQGKSVSETPIERLSVHQSPLHPKLSERATSEIPTERISETPQTPQPIDLSGYVTKDEFERQISLKDQEFGSLQERIRLAKVQLAQTQAAISSMQEKLVALSAPPTQSKEDNPNEGEKKAQEKDQEVAGREVTTQGSLYSLDL